MITEQMQARLQALKDAGAIAGWQDRGATQNQGLSKSPLPALIFPIHEGGASTFYDKAALETAIASLEQFGPMQLVATR